MTYRSLHIMLLVMLLALDAVMVNLSGVAAFWLRCRTAIFDTPNLTAVDLRDDDTPLFGAASRGRYRIGEGPWVALGDRLHGKQSFRGSLEVDLGMTCRIDEVSWQLAQTVPGTVSAAAESPGGKTHVLEVRDSRTGIVVSRFPEETISFSVSTGADGPVLSGDFTLIGANTSKPPLFQIPMTYAPERPYWSLLYVWNAASLFGLIFAGAYRITRSLAILDDFRLALKAVGIAAVTVIVILFLYRGYQEATYAGFEFSRLVVIFGAAFATILLTGNRAIVDAIHAIFLKRGVGIRKVVVVGAGPVGQNIVSRLRKHYWLAYEPVAFVDDNLNTHGASVEGLQVMGGTDVLPRVAKAVGTNEVIVALPNSSQKSIRDIVGRCQSENLKIHILPDLFEVISSDVKFGAIDGVPVLDLDDHYLGRWDRLMKRGLDVMTVLVGATILLPVWALIAALIKLGSRGPVLFNQSRVGENGKTFDCIKFRTMGVITAEEEREERQRAYADLIEQGQDVGGKIVNHGRVTWIGGMLRKYRLDELPQILNVLKGEMSLVGPRPPIPYEIEHYDSWHMERLKGTPGITGLWQVSGGPSLSFDEMVKLDLYYLKNWSLWLDFKILLKTIPVVLSGKGA